MTSKTTNKFSPEVLGPRCAKCKAAVDLIDRVAKEEGKDVALEKIEDMQSSARRHEHAGRGDRCQGRAWGTVPSRDQVLAWVAVPVIFFLAPIARKLTGGLLSVQP